MVTYQFYRLDASGQILDHSIEVECDHDEMALAVGSAQIGTHVAVEIWSRRRLVGRVAHAGIQDSLPTSVRFLVPEGLGLPSRPYGQEGEAVMSGPKWNAEDIERLRKDWAAGLSIATIAQRLETTKSAVTAKAKRLGLKKGVSLGRVTTQSE